MADSPEHEEAPVVATYHDERRFADAVAVGEWNSMVYIEFLQEERQPGRSSDYVAVSRLAISPALAGNLADQLSRLRQLEQGPGAIPDV